MPGNDPNPLSHFGKQLKKERLARGWSLPELSRRTGIDAGHLSRIENGKRPPTAKIALACDKVFPNRQRWFTEFYADSRTWAPPGFRSWAEYEERAASLRTWCPGLIHGLLQTEDYARALLATSTGVNEEIVAARLASRLGRQRRVLMRKGAPNAWLLVDEVSLYRFVGSTAIMADQMRQLGEAAAMPNVKLQVLPMVAHPANASEMITTESAAYTEHLVGGYVYSDEDTFAYLNSTFDALRGECYRVSESATLIREMQAIWESGVSPLTRMRTAGPA